jgi:hypothetical protein
MIKELTEKLSEQGYTSPGRKKTQQQAALVRGLLTIEEYEDIVQGWLVKPKGLLQVFWEQGLINPNGPNIEKSYTLHGQQNSLGIINLEYYLKNLLGSCIDFDEEEMVLQSMGCKIGVMINRMLKCNQELAVNQDQIMKFSKQAQEYICAYHTIMQKKSKAATPDTHLNDPMVTPKKIEKLIEEFKMHHCALDFDYSCIMEGLSNYYYY